MHAESNSGSGSHNDSVEPVRRPRASAAAPRRPTGRKKPGRDEKPDQGPTPDDQQQEQQQQQQHAKQPQASPEKPAEQPYQYKALTARRVSANRANAAR